MKRSDSLDLEIRGFKTRLNELAGQDTLTDVETTECGDLEGKVKVAETQFRAAKLSEDSETRAAELDGESAEERELRSLRGKVGLTRYIAAASEKRNVDGPELEFNQMLGVGAHRFPLELLVPVEERAKTGVDTVATPSRWVDRLFSVAAASRVGVTFESVAPGAKSYPITKTGATGAQRGRTEEAAIAAWTVGVTELKPTRNAVHAVFSREDDLRNPGLQDALTRDLRSALMDAVDLAVFEGDSGANEDTADITGLQTAADVVEEELMQAEKVKGADVLGAFAAMIDGKHATSGSDLRTVLSVGAQRLWMSTLANTGNAADTTISEFLTRAGIVFSARGGIDTETTNGKFGAFVGRGRGIEGAGIAAVWSDAMILVDPYSSSRAGSIELTMNAFWAFGLPRPSNFARLKFVT